MKADTVKGLNMLRMDLSRGHTFDYQDVEKNHFGNETA